MMNIAGLLRFSVDDVTAALPGSGAGTRFSLLAIELPKMITPVVAGLTVGLFVGIVGIALVLFIAGRSQRKANRRGRVTAQADQVVLIPPYGTMQRDTPLPPQAFATPGRSYGSPASALPSPSLARARHGSGQAFVPSTALSARAFAKMGYAADDDLLDEASEVDSPTSEPLVSIDIELVDEEEELAAPASTAAPVTVSPVVMISSSSSPPSTRTPAPASAPHPLGIIKTGSVAMRPASFADLAFDDGPTEIAETYFDEPPQPRRRTDPPKIRAKAPAAPRFPQDATPPLPQAAPKAPCSPNRSS